MSTEAKVILEKHELRKTPFRLKVLELFLDSRSNALTNHDLEKNLKDFDRITLYRTLRTFEKSGIVHQAIDGSNESKFALCHNDCTEHHHEDNHAHFLCQSCNKTYCIDNVVNQKFELPEHFSLSQVHVALSGTCAECH